MARRSAGSTEGAVVEVARSMRAATEESAAGVEGEALGPCSDDGGRPEARGIAAVWCGGVAGGEPSADWIRFAVARGFALACDCEPGRVGLSELVRSKVVAASA